MPYFCTYCGEENDFRGWQRTTRYGEEEIFFDRNGVIQDYGDFDETDSESGDWTEAICNSCGEDVTSFGSDEELERAKREFEKINDTEKELTWKERLT